MINAKALIGTMLETIALQKVIGQGEIGAVFLAQQSHPHRQVAVKILAPAIAQTPNQRAAFLERFRQEANTLTSLQHQNILPVYDHGEYNGHVYLVMPYISGGTLQNAIEQEGPLELSKAVNYLKQIASALDYAHKQGIIHQDVKPTNVLIAPEGRLLLTDFGMVKIVAERQTSQRRLLRAGTPIGTPGYMAPEQVMGDAIDARTDIYSLGIMLYQMVTGKVPFQGEAPMQTATHVVQMPPPSPRLVRIDLPEAAEQAILQATAKRPQDRYVSAQDFARAFHDALASAGGAINRAPTSIPLAMPRKRGLFDPVWQEGASEVAPSVTMPTIDQPANGFSNGFYSNATGRGQAIAPTMPTIDQPANGVHSNFTGRGQAVAPTMPTLNQPANGVHSRGDGLSSPWVPPPTTSTTPVTGDLKKSKATRLLPAADTAPAPTGEISPSSEPLPSLLSTELSQMSPVPGSTSNASRGTRPLPISDSEQRATTGVLPVPDPISPFPTTNTTGALMVPGSESGTLKLTGAVKVVQVPIAGQPGRYVTGFLPVIPQTQQPEELVEIPKSETNITTKVSKKLLTRGILALLVLFVLSGSGIFIYAHTRPNLPAKIGVHVEHVTPNLRAIAAAEATATATANIILTDSLKENIHNWPIAYSGYKIYVFKNGAYHITDNDTHQVAPALLPGVNVQGPMAYTLTMEEISGDDTSINNSFGMILRFSTHTLGGKSIVTFYTFEVLNTKNGEYQFSKYDNSQGPSANPWTLVWHSAFGGEFDQGHGLKSINTFKVITNGHSFTFIVNGKNVKTVQDGSYASGEVGMLVNLKGTEVAFSDLILTHN